MKIMSCIFAALIGILALSSCEKKEAPIELPPVGDAQFDEVSMGLNYDNEVYYNFSTGSVVKESPVGIWDIAFESSEDGYHVFMNGGIFNDMYNTKEKNIMQVQQGYENSFGEEDKLFDDPTWNTALTGVGEWLDESRNSKMDIYLLYIYTEKKYIKIRFENVTKTAYVFSYADMNALEWQTVTLPKNAACNYTYFSFKDGGMAVTPEPPKETWDIVFTRYRYIYKDMNNYPYLVTGVLLNPYQTTALKDTVLLNFEMVTYENMDRNALSAERDIIGFDWKSYNIEEEKYTTHPDKIYIVKTQQEEFWKLHFIGYVNENNERGNPLFEFKQIH